jgi:cytochrome c oxidase assembly protein subunit 11
MNKNKKTLISFLAIAIIMFGLSFAFIPLYNLFCRITGFGGTGKIVRNEVNPNLGTQNIKIFFNADIDPKLKMEFKPKVRRINSLTGKRNLVFYQVKNISDKNIKAIASYNISPPAAGEYFSKIDCFCFYEQNFKPGQEIDLPISFYIDKDIEKDPFLHNLKEVTLSYNFFPIKETSDPKSK